MRYNWYCEYSILKNKLLYISLSVFEGIVSRDSILIKFCEVTSRYTCVRWCFALKGQRHRIFCFRFFSEIIFLQTSKNPQICGLTKFFTFADFPHVWQFADLRFADLRFADPIFFAICGFVICWPNLFANLKLMKIFKIFIFLLTNTYLKCSNSNFYQIQNSA